MKKAAKKSPVKKEEKPEKQVKTIRLLAAPILRLKFDLTRKFTIQDSEIGAKTSGKYLLPAKDLATGETVQVALPTQVMEILESSYRDRSYIGRSFAVTKYRYAAESKAWSKRAAYLVKEIEIAGEK